MKIRETLERYLQLEKYVLENNKEEIIKQNKLTLQIIVFAFMVIFSVLLVFSLTWGQQLGYGTLSIFYLFVLLFSIGIFLLLKFSKRINILFLTYASYTVAFIYCAITSGWVNSSAISIAVLVIISQIPILYLDKSRRLNLFVMLGGLAYLISISLHKAPFLYVDELINTITFALFGIIIGSFARYSRLEIIYVKCELNHFANYDPLTNIFNRRKLFNDLQEPQITKNLNGICMVDADYFKKYNDTYGHQMGDLCLKKIVDSIRAFQEQNNILVYRYGGEEILIAWLDTPKEIIIDTLEAMRLSVEALEIEHMSSEFKKVTVSIGLSTFNDNKDLDFESEIDRADKALYLAKVNGKNQVVVYDDALLE